MTCNGLVVLYQQAVCMAVLMRYHQEQTSKKEKGGERREGCTRGEVDWGSELVDQSLKVIDQGISNRWGWRLSVGARCCLSRPKLIDWQWRSLTGAGDIDEGPHGVIARR